MITDKRGVREARNGLALIVALAVALYYLASMIFSLT